jgi:hypothetical protein
MAKQFMFIRSESLDGKLIFRNKFYRVKDVQFQQNKR